MSTETDVRMESVLANPVLVRIEVEARFVDKVIGGLPKHPDMLALHLERQGITGRDAETVPEQMDVLTEEQVAEVVEQEKAKVWRGFLRMCAPEGMALCLGDYQVKAGLREGFTTTGLMAVDKVRGKPSYRNALQHGLCVVPKHIVLSRQGLPLLKPDGQITGVIHAWTPQGQIAALKLADYVLVPEISFAIEVIDPRLATKAAQEHLRTAVAALQRIGLGADRSQQHGQFVVTRYDEE